MKTGKLLSLFLCICLVLSCVSVAFATEEIQVAELVLDQSVSVSAVQDDHVFYFSFSAEEAGSYVVYNVEEGLYEAKISVFDPLTRDGAVAEGVDRAVFEAQAGATYRICVECAWTEGAAIGYTFAISRPVEVESISIEDASMDSGFVGQEGTLALAYHPLNAVSEIFWLSSDPNVLQVSGDREGARFQLVGPGKAMVIAATNNGKEARFQVTVKAADRLLLDVPVGYTMEANGGSYTEREHHFSFVAPSSGMYALSASYDDTLDVYHDLQMSTGVGDDLVTGDDVLRFYAEAGQVCYLNVEFWGAYDLDVVYEFVISSCVPAQSIVLRPEKDTGYVGSSVDVQVVYDPVNSLAEPLTWASSDPTVLEVKDPTSEYATLSLLAPGVATVTATTESGVVASVQITVYQVPETIVLTEQTAAPVLLLGGGYVEVSFTPTVTAYYRITSDQPDLEVYLYADSTMDGASTLYYLEAGKTYYGGVDNYSAQIVEGSLYITQDLVRLPISMKITKLPVNTQYLKGTLQDMWTYQLLAGMEMDILWSDGTTTRWSFDEEGAYVGYEYLDWKLVQTGRDDQVELRLQCGEMTASCMLSVLDKSVDHITLMDPSVLQVVEDSCGMQMEDGSWYYSPYLANMRWVEIHFSDGSVSTVRPEQQLYGYYVTCEDSQMDAPWVKGGQATVTYGYAGATVQLQVQIIDSPVDRIELVQLPKDTFVIGDDRFFSGEDAYYFAPDEVSAFIEGLVFRVWYKDGSEKLVTEDLLEWVPVMDVVYPCFQGYPLGLFGELMMSNELITQPCDREGIIEYMGASVVYTIHLVDGVVVDPPDDPTDPPDDPTIPSDTTEPTIPSDITEPTEPSEPTKPTEPSLPSEPTEPSEPQDPTQPSQSQPTTGPTEPQGPGERKGPTALIVVLTVVLVAGAVGAGGWILWQKKQKK